MVTTENCKTGQSGCIATIRGQNIPEAKKRWTSISRKPS